MPGMREDELTHVLGAEISNALGYLGGELSQTRRKALEYYLGEPFGNEIDGRSQVIMTEVRDVIESALPGLVEVFLAGEEAVRYEPVGPEDMEQAEQATQYINHLFLKKNDGFGVLTDFFKDGLLSKVGFIKAWWEEFERVEYAEYADLTADDMAVLLADPEVEVAEQGEGMDPDTGEAVYDLSIRRRITDRRLRVSGVPPEEMLISRRAKTLEDATFVGHRVQYSVAELKLMGFDKRKIDSLSSDGTHEYNEERTARYQHDDEWPIESTRQDDAGRRVWIVEAYVRIDYDGDGVPELRQITCSENGGTVLANEEVSELPFVAFCPIPIPHKFFGLSLADLVMDLQETKSAVMRQLLDNMYLVNNGRTIINESVNLDDMLTSRPGQIVRSSASNVNNAAMPLVTQSLGQYAYPLLEYLDAVREVRTGVTRYNQGLDADSLNKTATGIKVIQGMAAKRQQLLARHAANAVAQLFRLLLRMVVKYQDRAAVMRLRGEWVEIDPRPWNADMDVTVTVGLGYGTKDEQLQSSMAVMQAQERMVQFQGGVQGPLVTMDNIYNATKKMVEASGLRTVEPYFTDPGTVEPPEQQPSPEMIEAQAEAESKKAEMEARAEELRHAQAKLNLEAQKAHDEARFRERELDIREMEARARVDARFEEIDTKRDEIDSKEYTAEVAAERRQQQQQGNER